MTSLLINLSAKKAGTHLVYYYLQKLFSSQDERLLFVPPIKEWYMFPEKVNNYFKLPQTILERHSSGSGDLYRCDYSFLLKLLAYELNGFSNKYFDPTRGLDGPNREQLLFENIDDCYKRFCYIFDDSAKLYRSLYLSDPNFQKFLLGADDSFQKYIASKINFSEPAIYFALIRHPKELIRSVLKLEPDCFDTVNEESILALIKRYDQFSNLTRFILNCKQYNPKILVFDFHAFVKNQKKFIKLLLDFAHLNPKRELFVMENPNPGKKLSQEKQKEFCKIEELIDFYVDKKIDDDPYLRLSHEKISVLEPNHLHGKME